ncbi:MAG: 3-phosphoshikimate 1-carboxyvinyltransferase [Candidatus Latescibacteria bacterium]|nr:3-phosphoshikimate 1-carboxyvinyltransferase [Candidatus Latescibacterota bacterium]
MKALIQYTERLQGHLDPPSSKNYTTRYLLVAALAEGESVVHFPAHSDDAEAMLRCLRALGAQIREERDPQGKTHLHIRGFGRHPANPGVVDPGNAGAVLRLLLGVGSLLPDVSFETRFTESLGQRPHGDLLGALEQLGVQTESAAGRLPVRLRGGNLHGGRVQVSGAKSSQYLSSLLFLAPLIGEAVQIEVIDELVSQPLIHTTLEVMAQAGIEVEAAPNLLSYRIPGGQAYRVGAYTVNGDYPSAAAMLAAGAVTNSRIGVDRLFEDCQGERAVVPLLRRMGVGVDFDGHRVTLRGHQGLRGVDFDGDRATDMVLAMLGVAALAEGQSRFHGIANLRLKECDCIAVPVRELQRLGVDCEEGPAEILIRGCPAGYEGGVEVPTYHDHRVAQLLTIVGLRCRRGLTVLDAENVGKSYPAFFQDLIGLGARIELVE